MTKFGKFFFITFFITLLTFTTFWDYFKNDSWALLENSFYSLCVTIFLFMAILLRRRKKSADN
ncbi:RNA polymerase sigma factor [Lysinibacillus odysseyi 34hs-1 = NBRC 100172]|uniref:RNA polymerase sigma factor n=1 Tax=Lysinibacillus odysseyi 34hs-1 = NBRC 100172 TaxID=1220589 RepID=A0A0A3IAU0_9BACI|nr:RNA polymerase sigma factor [Lysinibacillus odysseyi 34hs-1 = NBRC 100172]